MVMTTPAASASGYNPLKADPELKALLEESKEIASTAQFDRWRKSFLRRVDDILRQDGDGAQLAAKASYSRVSEEMDSFGRKVLKLQMCVKNGSVSPTRISVRGQNALNEVKDGASQAMFHLINWMPAVKKDEDALGYTKWVLGAVLVRNGFEIYETMILCRDILEQAKTNCLDQIADRQTLDAIDYYGRQIERFCSVMSDLGLMELMMRSHDLRSASDWAGKKKRSLSGNLEFMISPLKEKREEPAGRSFADGMDHIDTLNIDSDSESESEAECDSSGLDDKIGKIETENDEPNKDYKEQDSPMEEKSEEPGGKSFADGMDHIDTLHIDSDSESEAECSNVNLDDEIGVKESEAKDCDSRDGYREPNEEEEEMVSPTKEKSEEPAGSSLVDGMDHIVDALAIKSDSKSDAECNSGLGDDVTSIDKECEPGNNEHTKGYKESEEEVKEKENETPKDSENVHEDEDEGEDESPRDVAEDEADIDKSEQTTQEAEQTEACSSQDDKLDAEEEICPDTSTDIENAEDENAGRENAAPTTDDAEGDQDSASGITNDEPENVPEKENSGQSGGGDGPPRPQLRVQFGAPQLKKYNRTLRHDDCVMVPALFGKEDDMTNYYSLVEEITKLQQKGVQNANWSLSQDGSHLVCEDATMSKTVESITSRVCKYFSIRKDSVLVKVDMFRDGNDTKPPKHDIIAYKPKNKSEKRNIAVHVSFGVERELSLTTNGDTAVSIYFPQRNNWAFSVGRDVNVRFENGIAKSDGPCEKGRVCVRLYGRAKGIVDEDGSPDLLERDD